MKNIKDFKLFEAGKNVMVETEQENQAKYNDQIKAIKVQMSKLDASNKKQSDKTKEKAKFTGQIAKLTMMIGQSMQKEAQSLTALAQEQSKL